jgi:hypothetical protein
VATNYWTDLSLSNQIVNPMLTSISRTNVGAFLDPRPKAGSPAGSNYAATPAGLTQAGYQGAFGSGRSDWASDWTALSEYGIITGAGGSNPLNTTAPLVGLPPTAPVLSIVRAGGNMSISFASESGHNYQLQSAPAVTGVYTNVGSAVSGTGGATTSLQPANAGPQFFRVLAF